MVLCPGWNATSLDRPIDRQLHYHIYCLADVNGLRLKNVWMAHTVGIALNVTRHYLAHYT